MLLSDSHAHLCVKYNEAERRLLLNEIKEKGPGLILDAGIHIRDFTQRREALAEFDFIHCAAAIAPHFVMDYSQEDLIKLEKTCAGKECVAVGETGLEYFHFKDNTDRNHDKQKELLEFHIHLAEKYNKPLILHVREAYADIFPILKKYLNVCYVNHCFSGSVHEVKKMLDLDAMISFAGNLTYKNAHTLRDACKMVPNDKILFETDTPFLSPEPVRGKKNSPLFVHHTYAFAAALRNQTIEDLAANAVVNFKSVFLSEHSS